MNVFFYDGEDGEGRRDWRSMLGSLAVELNWRDDGLRGGDDRVGPERGDVIVCHRVGELPIEAKLRQLADNGVYVVSVSGSDRDVAPPKGNIYLRAGRVSNPTDERFAVTFGRFRQALETTGEPTWALLEPEGRSLEFRGALAILCQGYLAAHSGSDGAPRQDRVPKGEYAVVQQALEKMGWTRLCEQPEGDLASVLQIAATRADEVRRGEWWAKVLGDGPALMEALGKEFPGGTVGAEVSALVQAIGSGTDVPPVVVARAYLELAAQMDGAAG